MRLHNKIGELSQHKINLLNKINFTWEHAGVVEVDLSVDIKISPKGLADPKISRAHIGHRRNKRNIEWN